MAGAVAGKVHTGCYTEIPHPEGGQALEQGMVTDPEPQDCLDSTLRHSMGLLARPLQGQELHSGILEGLFQLRIFCESVSWWRRPLSISLIYAG